MTCIALSGYYGFYNTGDEAILEVIIEFLQRQLPGVEVVVFSADPGHTRRTYGVEAVSRTHLSSIVRTLRRADLLISGGGGLLQDITSFRSVAYYLGIIELAMMMGKKVAIFAQGMGPLHHHLAMKWVKRVVDRVDVVSVRDPFSARFLEELGVKREVRVTADPVFSLDPASQEEIEAFWRVQGIWKEQKQLQVGIALRPFLHVTTPGTDLLETIIEACIYLEKEYGARLIILPYHLQKDLPLARQVASRLSRQSLIIDRALSAREVMCLIGGLDLLVGMRLHALIFAAVSGIPFVALPYDPKINAFLFRLGKEAPAPLQELTPDRLKGELDEILSQQKRGDREGQGKKIGELKNEVQRALQELFALVSGAR